MTPQSVTYSAVGTCTTFGFDFPVFEPADLEVLLNGAVQTSGFTLLGAGSPEGGAVRFATAPSAGTAVTLRRTGKVQVSDSDAPGFLEAKVVAGAHITVTKTTDAAGEHLSIATDINPADFATAAQGVKADSALQPSAVDTTVQAHDANLDWVAANLSTAGKSLIDDDDASAQRATLGLGSAATKEVDTDGLLGANSDAKIASQKAVRTYVDVAVRANLATRDQLALTNTRLLLNSSVGTGGLIEGRQWKLASDEWGSASTNETYVNASPCYYANPETQTIVPGVDDWNGNAIYSYGSGIVSSGTTIDASTRTVASYSGDFSASATITSPSNVWNSWGIYDASLDGGYNANTGTPCASGHYFVYIQGGIVRFCTNVTEQGAASCADGDTFVISRTGNTIKVYQNGALVWTFSQSCTASAVKVFYGRDNNPGTQTASAISFVTSATATNMTLMPPTALNLSAVPDFADCYFLYKDDSGSAILGTDLTVELSRDGGSTWTLAPLTSLVGATGFDGTYGFVRARASLFAQPTGTSLICRIKTLNNKAQRVAAPTLYAE